MQSYKIKKQVCFGTDGNGKRIRKWVYANSKSEFNRKVLDIERELKQIRNPSDITFGEYSKKWLNTFKSHKEINTIAGYKNSINKCNHFIASVRIRDVCKSDLQQIINADINHPDTCRKINMTLKQIFDAAMDDGIIAGNPAVKLDVPKHKAKEKRSFTAQERNAVKTAILSPEDRLYLDLLYYCGLRRGEALALTRSDFNFKTFLLTVGKSVAFDENRPVLKDTKTHVIRYVPIPEKKAAEWKKAITALPFILFSRGGNYFSKTAFRRMWERIENSINLQMGGTDTLNVIHLTPHMIRHDYATRLYYVPGISPKKKAEILGHSEKLFLELYSHIDQSEEDMKIFQSSMNF